MFISAPWSTVLALDAATGELIWRFDPEVPREWGRNACCDVVNRGVALWKGKIYIGTIDGRLIALDANTGKPIWGVNTIDRTKPYTITGAPRVVKGNVIIGNGGAEYGVRGYVTAYDADTGDQVWRFYTVPGDPSQPFEHPELEAAAKTWTGRWWELGGGGTVWDSMAYDPELDLLYIGTGNGSPWSRRLRSPDGGDNLFLVSILALRPDTGRLEWHYQTTPAENWDYTATQHIILADLEIAGRERKVLMQAPKNGFFYVLDRKTGELISAEKYVRANWASHVDPETGRPVETETADYDVRPQVIWPGPDGAHGWHPMSFSPDTGLVYIPAMETSMVFALDKDFQPVVFRWNTGIDWVEMAEASIRLSQPASAGYLKAWDPINQREAWSVKLPGTFNGGVLSTAGNLVFQGTADGRLVAYAADSGEKLWEVAVNISIVAPPIAYSVGGEQYLSVVAGWGGSVIIGQDAKVSPAYEYENVGRVFTFKLGADSPIPVPPQKSREPAEVPTQVVSRESVARGSRLYSDFCAVCHGAWAIGGAVTPDLRYSSQDVNDSFEAIVLGGALSHNGMAGFSDVLDAEDVEDLHAFVLFRAQTSKGSAGK
jgi:PQQ-dependent dehydrogenase (methanol/ethanol family)